MVQPAEALAADVKYKVTCTSAGNGKVVAAYDSEGSELDWYEAGSVWDAVINGNNRVRLKQLKEPAKVEPDSGYVLDYWIADKDLYINGGWGFIGHATTISKGSELRSSLSSYYVYAYEDLKLTAYFKRKPAAITYKTDGHGTVGRGDESVEINAEHKCGAESLSVGKTGGTTATPADSTKYEFDHWTADQAVYKLENDQLTTIPAGTQLTSTEGYYVSGDVTFTAHFKRKPVTVSYATDGNGTVSMASQEVQCASTLSLVSDPTKELTVGQPRYEVDATPNNNFRLSYWTASEDVYVLDVLTMQLLVYSAGTPLPNEDIDLYYVLEDTTYTAHFLRTMYDITYESAGHGLVSLAAESMAVGSNPTGCTVTPDDGYDFEYWTANVDVEVAEESANPQAATLTASNAESEASTTTIAAGDPITDEQLKRAVSFSDDPVFTAHFKQVSSKIDGVGDADNTNSTSTTSTASTASVTSTASNSSNSNNSGSTSATSAASQAGSNLAPAMGDALFGVTVVAILCAGVTAALAALFRKRKS